MKLRVSHPAQPQIVEAHDVPDVVAWCRSLSPHMLAAHVCGLQGGLGDRFAFDTLGDIISRASDDELAALHRVKRGGR